MKKKHIVMLLVVSMTIVFSSTTANSKNSVITCSACSSGVVEKMLGEDFTVKIKFKNSGTTYGTWSVNMAFESESWDWSGMPQVLTLRSGGGKTLTWEGTIPTDIPIDSTARLVVYYNDSFQPVDWWIHVINGAELSVSSSTVK